MTTVEGKSKYVCPVCRRTYSTRIQAQGCKECHKPLSYQNNSLGIVLIIFGVIFVIAALLVYFDTTDAPAINLIQFDLIWRRISVFEVVNGLLGGFLFILGVRRIITRKKHEKTPVVDEVHEKHKCYVCKRECLTLNESQDCEERHLRRKDTNVLIIIFGVILVVNGIAVRYLFNSINDSFVIFSAAQYLYLLLTGVANFVLGIISIIIGSLRLL